THPAQCGTVVLREDFLGICEGNHAAAIVLAQMDYWHYIKAMIRPQSLQMNEIAEKNGGAATQDISLWVYKMQAELTKDILGLYSERTVREAFKLLIEWGYLKERTNPDFSWDRTKQYQFCKTKVQNAVDLWYNSKRQNYRMQAEDLP